jgi:hypothetical protein
LALLFEIGEYLVFSYLVKERVVPSGSGGDLKEKQALHCAPPDFLLRLVAAANFMRLSLTKAAHVDVGECRVAGNPGALRSG